MVTSACRVYGDCETPAETLEPATDQVGECPDSNEVGPEQIIKTWRPHKNGLV